MDKRRINVRAIIRHNNKLLAVKHKEDDGNEASYWAVPGGGLDPKESLMDGVKRELYEETGVKAEVGKLLFIQQFPSGRTGWDEELEFFFEIKNSQDFLAIDLSETTHGQEELARIEFIDPQQEHILPIFLQTLDIAEYVNGEKTPYFYVNL